MLEALDLKTPCFSTCKIKSFKGVCCRISSRPISGFMGQTNIVRSMP
ncbi:hypothetical protein A607_0143 [Helicobacter pylori UMB_G1]|nr:hypothetical protein A607_0143 [Helicobacter pylori UMB_G1]